MLIIEEFEVKFKDKDSPQQRKMLLDALKDLYINIDKYNIVKRKDFNDQTLRFMDRFYITKGDIITLLEDYAFNLQVTEWGDILDDRDRPNNLLYILYIPNAKVGNWDYTKSREKLLYIKWNHKNRNIISFHTMSAVQQTNRDKLTENKTMNIQDVIDFVYTHTDEDFVLTDLEVLQDLKKDLKDGTKPIYELDDVKGIKDDIIQTIELNSEQKKVLNDFVKKVEGLYKGKGKIEEKLKNIKFQNVINENLSYDEIINKLFYTGNNNAHLKKFYDLKRKYNGKDVSNIKVITADISDEGYCDILFSVKATKDGKKKKELVGENGELRDNISDEYEVILRINDFWDLIDEFGLETKGDFTKADVVALIQLSQDIKIKDSTPSFWWMGTSFYLTQDNASLMPCNIPPKFWNRDDLRPNVKVSKSVEGVLKNLGFFTQQIAMSIKRALIQQGYLL
jgi:hypothetical protein